MVSCSGNERGTGPGCARCTGSRWWRWWHGICTGSRRRWSDTVSCRLVVVLRHQRRAERRCRRRLSRCNRQARQRNRTLVGRRWWRQKFWSGAAAGAVAASEPGKCGLGGAAVLDGLVRGTEFREDLLNGGFVRWAVSVLELPTGQLVAIASTVGDGGYMCHGVVIPASAPVGGL